MADCQTLAESYSMDAETYYLTGCVALAMDSYDEASSNFTEAYGEDATYDRAIQIYEAYLDKDMEADGTRYLEAALKTEAKNAEDYCNRGKVYYYMEDYSNAQKELTEAVNQKSTEGMLLLGMVYRAQGDTSNARSMYQQYVSADDQCIRPKATMDWHFVTWTMALMTAHWRISAKAWKMHLQKKCRICCSMRSWYMRKSWILQLL